MNDTTRRLALLACLSLSPGSEAQNKTVTYYYTDSQGNVLATTDESGSIVDRFDYRPFGEAAMEPKAGGPGFTSHVEDTESDLVYMQQRYYDPTIGRFLSIDPAGIDAVKLHNVSRYTYANDNPYLFVDRDGKEASLYWSSPTSVTATIRYSMSGTSQLPFDKIAFKLQTENSFGGMVDIEGSIVRLTTKLEYVPNGAGQPGVNSLNVVKDTNGVTASGRAETNKIGGNNVTVGATGTDLPPAAVPMITVKVRG